MKFIKNIFYDFNFLIVKRNLWPILAAAIVLLTLVIIGLDQSGDDQSIVLTGWEIYPICIFFLMNLIGIFANYKRWSVHFFSLFITSAIISILRAIPVLLVILLFTTILKLFGIIVFSISPYKANSVFEIISDLAFFYPLIQIPIFFWQYRKYCKDIEIGKQVTHVV